MNTLDSTLDLVARFGWRIFPNVNKIPALKNWPNECSRDPEVIIRWWRQWPDAMPSLVTGPRNGIVVLDVDVGIDKVTGRPYSGFDTLETVFKWPASPPVPCVHTKRGGAHFYFACLKLADDEILNDQHPAHKTAILNSVSKLGPHVDVRGWNGYVVLPAAGTGYTVDPELGFDLPMPPAPAWFNHRPLHRYRGRSRFDPIAVLAESCRRIRQAPEGTRHDCFRHETFRIAQLVGAGLLDPRLAYSDLSAEIMTLGKIADGHTDRVGKYFEMAWSEGLAAARERRR